MIIAVVGGLGVALYSTRVYNDFSQMVMSRELMRSEEEAMAAYYGENLNVAIRMLSSHRDLLHDRLAEGLPHYLISEDEWLICARLGKLWKRAGDEAKASSYFESAISLLERDGPLHDWQKTPESLLEFVDILDAKARDGSKPRNRTPEPV